MQKIIMFVFIFAFFFYGMTAVSAQTVSFSVFPQEIRQGDPFLIQIDGAEISSIMKLTFDGKKKGVFMYQSKPTALVGIDLRQKPGTYKLRADFTDGTFLEKNIEVILRDKIETPLGIPEKLGGNTKASADKLVSTLTEDNKALYGLRTNVKALWREKFSVPLKEIFVTSPYGNSRKTGEYSIAHKGADYRAKTGTEVKTINRGVVRFTKTLRNHGKTIVIDHGMGVMSFYLHMSKIKVKVGEVVKAGKVIGLAGATGYTLGAHLHLGIRINEIAIDPEKFFELFKDTN